jgi:hypothetical protein
VDAFQAVTCLLRCVCPVKKIMKTLLKRVVADATRRQSVARVLGHPWSPCGNYVRIITAKRQRVAALQGLFCKDLVVKHGPFKGMRYPRAESVGSSILPKLLGSYEHEIAPLIEQLCCKQFTEVVDIGCAEGYYAVGLAMRMADVKVLAFDTDYDARRVCREMAALNNVSERVAVGALCDQTKLLSLPLTEKALIISDCEGYEKLLFTEETSAFLAKHELLIEVHDFIDPTISEHLRMVLQSTHKLTVYCSLPDVDKVSQYGFEELALLSAEQRLSVLREGRECVMEWLHAEPLCK